MNGHKHLGIQGLHESFEIRRAGVSRGVKHLEGNVLGLGPGFEPQAGITLQVAFPYGHRTLSKSHIASRAALAYEFAWWELHGRGEIGHE